MSCSLNSRLPLLHLRLGVYTSMFTVSRWYFGSLARLTFSVRVCHTRTYRGRGYFKQLNYQHFLSHHMKEMISTLVQLLAFGSSSSTVVICFRKSDSCIPGWDPRRLNTALGLDKMTCRLTANPLY